MTRRGAAAWWLVAALSCVVLPLHLVAAEQPSSTHGEGTGRIFGTLVDGARPVPYAIVSISKLFIEEQTGEDGTFRLTNVPAGTYTLRVRRLRRADFTAQVTVAPDREDTIVVRVPRPMPECPRPTPECTLRDGRQHKRIGKPCELHPWVTLVADTVRATAGVDEPVALAEARRDSFPNALLEWRWGLTTVSGRPTGGAPNPFGGSQWPKQWANGRTTLSRAPSWIEVAYCRECRAAYWRHWKR